MPYSKEELAQLQAQFNSDLASMRFAGFQNVPNNVKVTGAIDDDTRRAAQYLYGVKEHIPKAREARALADPRSNPSQAYQYQPPVGNYHNQVDVATKVSNDAKEYPHPAAIMGGVAGTALVGTAAGLAAPAVVGAVNAATEAAPTILGNPAGKIGASVLLSAARLLGIGYAANTAIKAGAGLAAPSEKTILVPQNASLQYGKDYANSQIKEYKDAFERRGSSVTHNPFFGELPAGTKEAVLGKQFNLWTAMNPLRPFSSAYTYRFKDYGQSGPKVVPVDSTKTSQPAPVVIPRDTRSGTIVKTKEKENDNQQIMVVPDTTAQAQEVMHKYMKAIGLE